VATPNREKRKLRNHREEMGETPKGGGKERESRVPFDHLRTESSVSDQNASRAQGKKQAPRFLLLPHIRRKGEGGESLPQPKHETMKKEEKPL